VGLSVIAPGLLACSDGRPALAFRPIWRLASHLVFRDLHDPANRFRGRPEPGE
jgi:hypothetical protein